MVEQAKEPVFTRRQLDVMNGINRELSYKEIASELGNITENTVRAHAIAAAAKVPEFEGLPPRYRIFAYIRAKGWDAVQQRLDHQA